MNGKECRIHKLVADVLVLYEEQVLLMRYNDVRNYDGQKGWFLPNDYLAYGEHPLDAARRILREQVGLEISNVALNYIESFGGEDGDVWHLVFHHQVQLAKIPTLTHSTNVKAAEWFPTDKLPDRQLVAHHGWANDVIAHMLNNV